MGSGCRNWLLKKKVKTHTDLLNNIVKEVKVVNENGRTVPFGIAGEVCFKGYNVMKGYYNDPIANENAFLENNWIRSGDKFILHENGYGKVVGRIKDTIIRGGENIEPSEIEAELTMHPDVINVQAYAVFDKRLGETVAVSIVKAENSSLDEDDVRNYCRGKITQDKIPKYVKFVNDFPRTATGKIQKFKLRNMLERELRLKNII